MCTVIVYVHGLWQGGAESAWLRWRLAHDFDAKTVAFSYPSVGSDTTTNAKALAKYLSEIRADTLHLIGHSLGGLVILRLFETEEGARIAPGRIVLMGSPLRGSLTAQNLARLPFGRHIMGAGAVEELLATRERRWKGPRDLGVIAGDLAFGLGGLVGRLPAPNDGTVLIEETELEGTADHIVLRVSHTGMLFSAEVARQAGAFFRTGRFSRDPKT